MSTGKTRDGGNSVTGGLSIQNLTRTKLSKAQFERARTLVLPSWDISLAFVGPARAQTLNKSLRRKTYTPNVLSYEVGPHSGEIIICPSVAKKQAPEYGMSASAFSLLLFIHGLFHLKGMAHGTTMEKSERAILARVLRVRP